MDYPTATSKIYSVSDPRLSRYGLSGNRPSSLVQPYSQPIPPVNMFPYQNYQMAPCSVPYGYYPMVQQMPYMQMQLPQQQVIPQHRLMLVQPGIRNTYSVADYGDADDCEFDRPPPREKKRVSAWLEELNSGPEMIELEERTKQIRKEADAALQRVSSLGKGRVGGRARDYFRDYDYSKIYKPLESREQALDRYEAEEEEPPKSRFLNRRRAYGRSLTDQPPSTSIAVAERIRNVCRDVLLDDSTTATNASYLKTPKAYDFDHGNRRHADKIKSEINVKAMLLDAAPIGRSASVNRDRPERVRVKIPHDPNEIKNNINFRAQYAAMRAAAQDYKKNED